MDTISIERMFSRIGARVRISDEVPRFQQAGIDIRIDKQGEYFDIRVEPSDSVEYQVIDVRSDMKHLLLMARRENGKQKFLCGHDERHWFVCAVPGESVSTVVNAMEALQPVPLRNFVKRRVRRAKDRIRRKNKAFVRQGEWFFVPMPAIQFNQTLVLKNEPLSRGSGSKPHMCQYLIRIGGAIVWVCRKYPRGVNELQYRRILLTEIGAKGWDWQQMRLEPTVYVKGRIWHPDHKTVLLNGWHQVLMNTERFAPGAMAVVFLD
jgi:hypothetical protein